MERLTFPSQKLTDSNELHLRCIAHQENRGTQLYCYKTTCRIENGIEAYIKSNKFKEQNVRSISIWETRINIS